MGPDVLLLFCYSLYKLSCHQRRKAVPEPNPSCPCRPLSSNAYKRQVTAEVKRSASNKPSSMSTSSSFTKGTKNMVCLVLQPCLVIVN